MSESNVISEEIKKATDESLSPDWFTKRIDEIKKSINFHESEIRIQKILLEKLLKERPPVNIKWRESVKWCLEVDSESPQYFLKTVSGVYKCVAFKYRVEVTPDIKNKVAVTLSALYKEEKIGRAIYNGIHIYGLKTFFKNDLTELKEEYRDSLDKLLL